MKKIQNSQTRFDLIPTQGLLEVHKVFSDKLEKYKKNGWREGISWSDVLSSLEKHLSEFKLGNDYTESNLLNIAEVAANALILAEYYSVYPQGDDRIIGVNTKPIICCDLDDCVFDFYKAYEDKFGIKCSDYWNGDYAMSENLEQLKKDKSFWVNMPIKNRPTFEIDYYVTAREIPVEWTMEAIAKNNLPTAKVFTMPWNASKIEQLKNLKCDIMIDDKFSTYKECQSAGIFCYLMDSPSNRYYNVGHRRIYDLNLTLK